MRVCVRVSLSANCGGGGCLVQFWKKGKEDAACVFTLKRKEKPRQSNAATYHRSFFAAK